MDEAQRSTALDLLCVPADVRKGRTPLDINGKTAAEAFAAVAADEVADLEGLIQSELMTRDEVERSRTILGMGEPTHEMRLIQRYLASAMRRHVWAKTAMNKYGQNYRPPLPTSQRPGPGWNPLSWGEDPARASPTAPVEPATPPPAPSEPAAAAAPPAAPTDPAAPDASLPDRPVPAPGIASLPPATPPDPARPPDPVPG